VGPGAVRSHRNVRRHPKVAMKVNIKVKSKQ